MRARERERKNKILVCHKDLQPYIIIIHIASSKKRRIYFDYSEVRMNKNISSILCLYSVIIKKQQEIAYARESYRQR